MDGNQAAAGGPGGRWRPDRGRVPLLAALAVVLVAALVVPAGFTVANATRAKADEAPASVDPGLGDSTDAPAVSAAATLCAKVAWKAGFSYANDINTAAGPVRSVVIAVAVALAESSCNPTAAGQNGPTAGCPNGSTDRGLWQINDCYHPEVSNACAYQIQCNADAAWNISSKGTNWTPWSTYNSGRWESFLSTARDAISGFTIMLKNRAAGTCLDAKASDVRNGGAIIQWGCNASDKYQQWTVVAVNGYNPVLRNVGAGKCLDAKASDVRNGGAIIQWACDTTNDEYQRWHVLGSGQLNPGTGNANALLENVGADKCLDAKASDVGNGGAIIQWGCDGSDEYQWWN